MDKCTLAKLWDGLPFEFLSTKSLNRRWCSIYKTVKGPNLTLRTFHLSRADYAAGKAENVTNQYGLDTTTVVLLLLMSVKVHVTSKYSKFVKTQKDTPKTIQDTYTLDLVHTHTWLDQRSILHATSAWRWLSRRKYDIGRHTHFDICRSYTRVCESCLKSHWNPIMSTYAALHNISQI